MFGEDVTFAVAVYLLVAIVAGSLILSGLIVRDDRELREMIFLGPWLVFALCIVGAILFWPVTAAAIGVFELRGRWQSRKLRREEEDRWRGADQRCPRCAVKLRPQEPDSDGVVRRFLCPSCETWYTAAQLEGRS